MKAKVGDIIVGLDIGTTKTCAIVGEVTEEGIDIIGIGTHPSKGLRKGVVINIEHTVRSIKAAIEEAELMGGCDLSTAYIGISGSHVKGFNSNGVVAVKDKEIRSSDVGRVIDQAKAVAIPIDREVIHVLPREFTVDSQRGIENPIGMCGVRLEAQVHIVTAAVTSTQNLIKCAQRCNLKVEGIVLEQLASSEAVLSDDEREIGAVLVDIGGGTTDLAIWSKGAIVHTSVLSLGGNHLTNDIAVVLSTAMHEAETIKQKYGCALTSMIDPGEMIDVPSVGGRPPKHTGRRFLAEIIEPRVEEIFGLVHREILQSGFADDIASGVIITGGSALLEGMPELAEEVMNIPVRRGVPHGIGGLIDVVNNPKYSTGVGLVLYGSKNNEGALVSREQQLGLLARFRRWLSEVV